MVRIMINTITNKDDISIDHIFLSMVLVGYAYKPNGRKLARLRHY